VLSVGGIKNFYVITAEVDQHPVHEFLSLVQVAQGKSH